MYIRPKPSRNACIFVGVLALVFSQYAAASLVELKWDDKGHFKHSAEIKAGGILEVCGKLPAGLKIDWHYKSPQALDFNIHYHEGKKVHMPVKYQMKTTLSEQFEVKIAQDYCWMWSNKTKEITTVNLSLEQVAQ